MKKIILALSLFGSLNAFAGAYGLNCESSDGAVKIGNGSLTIAGKEHSYFGEDSSVRLMGLDLVDFLKESGPKVVVSKPDALTAVAQGGVKVLKVKHFKDECGNSGTETKYSEAVGIYDMNGATLINVSRLTCSERVTNGHCN